MRTYLERGGMLFADAICSSREFNEAFAREMAAMFPEQQLERIRAATIRCFTHRSSAATICRSSRVASRSARAADGPLTSQVRDGEPYLEGLKLGDRYAVIFSPYE